MGPHCLVGLVILILASTELQVTGAALKPGRGQAGPGTTDRYRLGGIITVS